MLRHFLFPAMCLEERKQTKLLWFFIQTCQPDQCLSGSPHTLRPSCTSLHCWTGLQISPCPWEADEGAVQTGSRHSTCILPGKGLVHAEVKDKLLLNRRSKAMKFQPANKHHNISVLSIKIEMRFIVLFSEVTHRWGLKSHFFSL